MKSALTTLVIYAYSSFTSSYGPGPDLAKKFEEKCQCQVQMVDVGDAGVLVSRLKLEGAKTRADVAIGFDDATMFKAKSILHWKQNFIPYDWAPFAFIYNSSITKTPPKNLNELLKPEWKGEIILEDPRLSTPGLGFLLWVISEKGDDAWAYLKALKPQVKVVATSWDMAYGMFKKGQGQLVFSYWTSPAYHIQEEKLENFKAASFENGHYIQTEYMTVVPSSQKQELAGKFLDFIQSKEAQEMFPKKNYMYPISKEAVLPAAFEKIGKTKKRISLPEGEYEKLEKWLQRWREIFS